MKSPPLPTREAAPRQKEAAPQANQQRGNHTTAGPDGKDDFGAHAHREPQAIACAHRVLYAQIECGIVSPLDIAPDIMPTPALVTAAKVIRDAIGEGKRTFPDVLGHMIANTRDQAAQDEIKATIIDICEGLPEKPGSLAAAVERVREYHRAKQLWKLTHRLQRSQDDGDETGIASAIAALAALANDQPAEGLIDLLSARAFDYANKPERPHPVFKIGDQALCTEGNLTNIQAPPKAGKSAVLESMIAAAMNGNRQGPDTLGFSAENPNGHALIHIDTEQSTFDHDQLVRRALRRARLTEPPEWLMSFALVDLSVSDRRKAVSVLMDEAVKAFGGVFAVMIDGIGDLCLDPNDSAESFDLVHHLHGLAVRHCTTICTVLHENPNSEGGKTRGHLGSQLERKAETNLRLAKDKDGVTTVWAEKARHLYLPREQGTCFAWNDHERMHTSCGTAGEIKQAAGRERAQDEASKSFDGTGSLTYTALAAAICEALDLQPRSAKSRIKTWLADGIIRKDKTGNHHLVTP
jgi:hypothetical protein